MAQPLLQIGNPVPEDAADEAFTPEPLDLVSLVLELVTSRAMFSSLMVLLFASLLYLVVSRLLKRLARDSYLDTSLVGSLRVIVRWLFFVLTFAAVLQVWGVLDQFWAAATALVTLVAIGFVAVWSVLSNVLCSLILLSSRPFRIGQRIALPPDEVLEGQVVEITLLHTVLETDAGGTLKIPNNMFFQRPLQIRPAGYVPPPPEDSGENTEKR
ncbi:MAG: mechanosensitive ion channel family protein [Planctomycetota bacterium]